ncbi:MAG: carbohydrate binding domain-containing protein, partial [Planctomycetota bacterium]
MSKIYLVCTVLVLGLLLSGNVANAQNQIKNWEFDVPMNLDDVWNFWRSENFTSITIVEGAGLSGQYAMKVDIEPGPPSPLLVFQSNLGLEQGATYTISFMAKADAPRTVNVQLQARSNSPQPWRVFWIETVDLTTEVQT